MRRLSKRKTKMTDRKNQKRIAFRRILPKDKPIYEAYLEREGELGCEYSFANLYLWGRQNIAVGEDTVLLFSQFDRRSIYPFPLGDGNLREAIELIIEDARDRGIACRISGITEKNRERLEALFPDRFRFHTDEAAYDYVYAIDDLADLPGKKYDGKRNHAKRFTEAYPDLRIEAITKENSETALAFAEAWYESRLLANPDMDLHMERAAMRKALRDIEEIGLIGIMLIGGGRVQAISIGSIMPHGVVDVHFEKASTEVTGAYAIANREFARYIRSTHPEIKYLNREEDMGIEGLRRAKKSYHPCRMITKYWACLLEDGYDY